MIISHTREQIRQIVISTIIDVTRQVAHISLKLTNLVNIETKDASIAVLKVYGTQMNKKVICITPNHLLLKVVYEMNRQMEPSDEDRLDYIKEFINIIAGCTISKIKNEFFKNQGFIKFKLMELKDMIDDIGEFSYDDAYCFTSEFGNIDLLIQYTDIERIVN